MTPRYVVVELKRTATPDAAISGPYETHAEAQAQAEELRRISPRPKTIFVTELR